MPAFGQTATSPAGAHQPTLERDPSGSELRSPRPRSASQSSTHSAPVSPLGSPMVRPWRSPLSSLQAQVQAVQRQTSYNNTQPQQQQQQLLSSGSGHYRHQQQQQQQQQQGYDPQQQQQHQLLRQHLQQHMMMNPSDVSLQGAATTSLPRSGASSRESSLSRASRTREASRERTRSKGDIARQGVLGAKYTLEYELGSWTFGTIEVLSERQTGIKRTCKVAEKALLPSGASDKVFKRLNLLKRLRHRCICAVVDILEDEANYYIISERSNGKDLQDWSRTMSESYWIEESTVASYICHTLVGLTQLHAEKVFHGDLLPSCILLSSALPDAIASVTDFGLVSILDRNWEVACQTPNDFRDPEISVAIDAEENFEEWTIGAALDVYSVGAVAQYLLVGRRPTTWSTSSTLATMSEDRGRLSSWLLPRWLTEGREEDGWKGRSSNARDFVQWAMTQPLPERPTAAEMLRHPWLTSSMVPPPLNRMAGKSHKDFMESVFFAVAVGILLVPFVMPAAQLNDLCSWFGAADEDGDGLVHIKACHSIVSGKNLLVGMGPPPDEATLMAGLELADVRSLGVHDSCSLAAAVVLATIYRQEKGDVTMGPWALGQRACKLLFDRAGAGSDDGLLPLGELLGHLNNDTGRVLEQYCGVNMEELTQCLDEDQALSIDDVECAYRQWRGQGTPFDPEACTQQARTTRSSSRPSVELGMGGLLESLFLGCRGACAEQSHSTRRRKRIDSIDSS